MKNHTSTMLAALTGTALTLGGSFSLAQSADEAPQENAATVTQDETLVMSRRDAYRASTEQIVLHYGEGIKRAENLARVLRNRGFSAIAVAGGEAGEISLFVGRGIYGPYDQDDIDGGELGLHAINFYKERVDSAIPSQTEPSPESN